MNDSTSTSQSRALGVKNSCTMKKMSTKNKRPTTLISADVQTPEETTTAHGSTDSGTTLPPRKPSKKKPHKYLAPKLQEPQPCKYTLLKDAPPLKDIPETVLEKLSLKSCDSTLQSSTSPEKRFRFDHHHQSLRLYLRLSNPPVYVINDYAGAELACQLLLSQKPKLISFDTETSVTRFQFRFAPSTIQLATWDACYIIQIFRITFQKFVYEVQRDTSTTSASYLIEQDGEGNYFCNNSKYESYILQGLKMFPPTLRKILEAPEIIKVGINSINDSILLNQNYRINCRGIFDLQRFTMPLELPIALAKFARTFADPIYHDKVLCKKKAWADHKSRYWDRAVLSDEEVLYGSKDVFAVLSALRNFFRQKNRTLFQVNHEFDINKPLPHPFDAKIAETLPFTEKTADMETDQVAD